MHILWVEQTVPVKAACDCSSGYVAAYFPRSDQNLVSEQLEKWQKINI